MKISGVVREPDDRIRQQLARQAQIIKSAFSEQYNTPYGALYAPTDKESINKVRDVAVLVKSKQPTLCMLVGIGGSNMGALAIIQAMKGAFYNELQPEIRFYCADTIDEIYTSALLTIFEQELLCDGTVLLCIVTKSGTTTETVVNGALFLEILKKHRPTIYQEYVIFITDAQSPLASFAKHEAAHMLEIPTQVGGRFSVFTAVGLFPLAVLGIDIADFCSGASHALKTSLEGILRSEPALSTETLYTHYKAGYVIHDIFCFAPDLFMLGQWYKQLIGESLGKKYDLNNNLVEVGISPTISVGTVDLHSVVQLYLAGPRNKVTTFLHFHEESGSLKIPSNGLTEAMPGVAGRSVSFIHDAIYQGVMEAYAQEKRPYMALDLQRSVHSLGAFMMHKMLETLFLAKLLNINPFDQPAVEVYKAQTRKLLNVEHF